MALASNITDNERVLRKRLAARLRQRRCRERKREANKKAFQQLSQAQKDAVTSGRPFVVHKVMSTSRHVPAPSIPFRPMAYPPAAPQAVPSHVMMPMHGVHHLPPHPAHYDRRMMMHPMHMRPPPMPHMVMSAPYAAPPPTVTVSRTNSEVSSTAAPHSPYRLAPKLPFKELASKEMTAIDAMMSLRSKSDEDTASTASISTADESDTSLSVPKTVTVCP